ncbi:MAG: VOC family protein [Candidatus Neomarinimicrobiota bacterium]
MKSLTFIYYIAIESNNITKSVDWYRKKFNCKIKFQDNSWALLVFKNISLALVLPGQHPLHFAIVDEDISKLDESKVHRDGIRYIYDKNPDSNIIERIDRPS